MKCPTWANRLYVPMLFLGVLLQIYPSPSGFSATQRIGGHSSNLTEGFVAGLWKENIFIIFNQMILILRIPSAIVLGVSQTWGPLFTFGFPINMTNGQIGQMPWNALDNLGVPHWKPGGTRGSRAARARPSCDGPGCWDVDLWWSGWTKLGKSNQLKYGFAQWFLKFVVMINYSVQKWDNRW